MLIEVRIKYISKCYFFVIIHFVIYTLRIFYIKLLDTHVLFSFHWFFRFDMALCVRFCYLAKSWFAMSIM